MAAGSFMLVRHYKDQLQIVQSCITKVAHTERYVLSDAHKLAETAEEGKLEVGYFLYQPCRRFGNSGYQLYEFDVDQLKQVDVANILPEEKQEVESESESDDGE